MRFRLVAVVMLGVLLTGCIGGFGKRADVGVYMVSSGLETEMSSSSLTTLGLKAPDLEKEIKEVWVTITEVQVKRDGKWETIAVEHQNEIDLMALQFQQTLLGQASIPAGTYTAIRFQFAEEGRIEFEDGETKILFFPSSELKVDLGKKRIVAGSTTELIFDVNPRSFAKRGTGDVYNANPSKSLRFVEKLDLEFGELNVRIELPEVIGELLSIQLSLYKVGQEEPVWITELENDELEVKISFLPPGEYYLEASVTLVDWLTLDLSAGPIEVKVGEVVESILMETDK